VFNYYSGECIVLISCEQNNEPLSSIKGGEYSHRPLLHEVSYLGVSKINANKYMLKGDCTLLRGGSSDREELRKWRF
jgi:hypothetical protein